MTQIESVDILIVGTGHGGAQAALSLRQNGFRGTILMVGRDCELPYERPPLSKEYLSGEKSFERLLIRPKKTWQNNNIAILHGKEVTSIDAFGRFAGFSDGTGVRYGRLIWAGGGEPRKLSCAGAALEGVHAVRTRADVDAISAAINGGATDVVIIGGGYIGLEAAATLRKFDCNVTILETMPKVLARVAGEDLSQFFLDEHRRHGVDIRLKTSVAGIEGSGKRVTGVRLADGSVITAQLVVVGIGIEPSVAPLLAAGAAGENGVDVDRICRTNLPNVYAIGDCAAHENIFADGARIRLESVQNANDMATVVAKAICGDPRPYSVVPWFWSNQYDLKLQTVGLSIGHDATVLRGNLNEKKFSVVYLKRGKVIALDCVNNAKDFVQGRKLVEAGAVLPRHLLAETKTPLTSMINA